MKTHLPSDDSGAFCATEGGPEGLILSADIQMVDCRRCLILYGRKLEKNDSRQRLEKHCTTCVCVVYQNDRRPTTMSNN